MSAFDDMTNAVDEARTTIRRADHVNRQLATMLAGRLQVTGVSHSTLISLKKELQNYNMHTGQWRDA